MANNMLKSYLFTLLLFLLCVHQSLSFLEVLELVPIGKLANLVSKDKDVRAGVRFGAKLYKELENIKHHFSPPSPPPSPTAPAVEISPAAPPPVEISPTAPPAVEIGGLSLLKQYFSDFGYMKHSDSFTDYLDTETRSAINTYQSFFNLENNGELDNKTLTQLSFPRCAIPDLNFNYELTSTNNVSWPKGKWFPDDTQVLTYGFLPKSQIPRNFTKVFRDAFKRWSEAITEMSLTRRLNFTETTYNNSDIKIGFYNFGEGVEDAVVGGTIVRFQNGNKTVGDMRLDSTMYWVLPSYNGTWSWEDDDFDLETVAMHQIGHLLGLSHSSNNESVMYPYILPTQQKKVQLSDDEKENIKQLYSDTNSGGCGGRFTSTLLLATLTSLIGMFLLLMY